MTGRVPAAGCPPLCGGSTEAGIDKGPESPSPSRCIETSASGGGDSGPEPGSVFFASGRGLRLTTDARTAVLESERFLGLFDLATCCNDYNASVCRTDACENLAETASVCATECTLRIAVSCVGREHLRRLATCVWRQRRGRPTRATGRRLKTSGDVTDARSRVPVRARHSPRHTRRFRTLRLGKRQSDRRYQTVDALLRGRPRGRSV